jgi:hypothetical protein
MLDEQEVQIYVSDTFQQFLLPYEADDARGILSEFLCVCCEHWVPASTEEPHNAAQYLLTIQDLVVHITLLAECAVLQFFILCDEVCFCSIYYICMHVHSSALMFHCM